MSSRKKRWLKALGFAGLLGAALTLALPLWFPWVLRPSLARWGIHFDSYQRLGYTRFALTQVRAEFGSTRCHCDRIAGDLPPRWIWRRFSQGSEREPFLTLTRGSLQFDARKPPANAPPSAASTFTAAERVHALLPAWRVWLPSARLIDGSLRVGSNEVSVAEAEWQRGRLTATLQSFKPAETFSLDADFSGEPPYALTVATRTSALTNRVRLSRAADQWQAAGELIWQTNRVQWEAGFRREGWWPSRAGAKADHFKVPAKLLGLGGYEDLSGAFALDWSDGRFRLESSGRATPNADDLPFAPPVEFVLLARGDPHSVVLEKFRMTSPALEADLSNPIGLNRSGTLTTEAATLRVALDLAQLPGLSFGGRLQGQVRVRPMPAGRPIAEFKLRGEHLTGRGFDIARADLNGRLRWPALDLEGAELEFADGSILGGVGEYQLLSREVTRGQWRFQGGLARQFLPADVTYSNLQAAGQVSGPIAAPTHSGELTVEGFSVPRLKPCRLQATWRGERLTFAEAALKLTSGNSALEAAGAFRIGQSNAPAACNIILTNLTLARDAESLFHLEAPCAIAARPEAPSEPGGRPAIWQIKVDGFRWVGRDRGLAFHGDIAWPRHGNVEIEGHGLAPSDLADFVPAPIEGVTFRALNLQAAWDRGPIEFTLSAKGAAPALQGQEFSAEITLSGDTNGLTAEPVVILAGGTEILRARGTMPLTVTPGRIQVQLAERQPFHFQFATAPNPAFWNFAAQYLGVRVADPEVEAEFEGTLEDARGRLRARAAHLSRLASADPVKWPDVDDVRIEAAIERGRVRLSEMAFDIEKQPVRVTGDLPIGQRFLLDLMASGALPDWRRARARVEIDQARIEPFARYLPRALSSQGQLSVSLEVVPGAELNGELKIAGAATRPIMPLAPIRDIQATVLFSGRQAAISRFTGRIGGREVSLTGRFEWPESGEPQFDLRLRGDNVPLVYRPGVLLRSDFDFQVARAAARPVTVSGDVTLRDGLYLQDLKALVPTGRAQPLGRPPYFSVPDKPFADWRLNVKVHGDRFLRVRTPYFGGEVSADFQITGSLEEPQALGEARINSGLVRFPFGTLLLNQGQASLTSDQPYEPQLFATASSRLYGYNVKMEMTGTASAPLVSFTSTPPLTSEQILLMLAAGELPRDDMSISREKKAGNFALYLGKDILARVVGNEDSADRLTIRSGEDVSQEGKSTYYLEYRLTDDLSVVGEYDRFNAMNAGLKWKIFSR